MKKQVLLLFAALVFSQAAFAYDFSAVAPSGQTLYYSFCSNLFSEEWEEIYGDYEAVCVVQSGMLTGELVIPDSVYYNGAFYHVFAIGYSAFAGCSGLTSVTISDPLTRIFDYAFYNCSGLTSVTIPNSVPYIGAYAFYNCSGLTSVTIPNILTIGRGTFQNCSGLTSVTIPYSVYDIMDSAFAGCSGLTSVNYTGTATTWHNIDIGTGGNPIYYSHNLYLNNVLLTDLVFSNSPWKIKDNFRYDTALTSVTIPNSVAKIEDYAFAGCSGLTSVTIPDSVTQIGKKAFAGCGGLTSVIYNAIGCTSLASSLLSRPFEGCSNITSFIFGNNVGTIPDFLCSGLTGLTSVTIPNSVTKIEDYAFAGCSGLTSVTIPNSVTVIASWAFAGCSGLTSVTIPDSVTIIGSSAFSGCSGLTSVVFNADSCTAGGYDISTYLNAFADCSNITSFTFGNNVRIIPKYLCYEMAGLTSVTIPNSVSCIGDKAFYGCSGMTSMRFLSQVPPQLGTDVFEGIPTDIPVYIPCGRIAYYVNQMPQFSNFIETMVGFSAVSDDASMGTVQVLTAPSCTDHNAVLYAVPAGGYRFDHWSTGSTDNPYTLTVTTDTTIIAYFVSGGTQGIGEIGENDFHINVFNGRICVEGITNEEVRVYDITGRMVQNHSLPSGVYIVKVGTLPAQKVVVMR